MSLLSAEALIQALQPWQRALQRFLHWWGGELAGLVPRRLRRGDAQQQNRVLLRVEGETLRVLHCKGATATELVRLPLARESWDGYRPVLDRLDLPAAALADTTLRLPARRTLRRVLSLPRAVEEDLRQVLEYEMDRQTPLSADQVYYDFQVLERSARSGQVRVQLTIVPRTYIDPLLENVARLGFHPGIVDVEEADTGGGAPCARTQTNLCPPERRRRGGTLGKRLNRGLAGVTLALLLLVLALPLVQMGQAIEIAEKTLRAASREALRTTTLVNELNRSVDELRGLLRRKQTAPAVIEVLAELTRILPDATWLRRFEMQGSTIGIRGESDASTRLIALIEASPRFKNVRFRSPVTLSPGSNRERFQISAEVDTGVSL